MSPLLAVLAAAAALSPFRDARVAAFRELYGKLPTLVAEKESGGDRAGRVVAEMAREDMRRMERLFASEREAAALDPLAPGVVARRLNLRDFGAKGDGRTDDTAAFDRAVAALKAFGGEPAILDIPSGEYLLSTRGRRAQLFAQGLANCIVRGESPESTRLVFGDYCASGVELAACTNVTLANVNLAYAETPFSQGCVVAFDKSAGTADIEWREGTLAPDDPRFASRPNAMCCAIFDESGRRIVDQEVFFALSAERMEGKMYRVRFDTGRASYSRVNLKAGWTLAIPDRDNSIGMVRARDSFLCNFDGVWIRNSRAAAFALAGASYTSLWKCRVVPKDRDLVLSSNADGVFVSRGAFVAHCEFRNMNDDGLNCLAFGRPVKRVEGRDTVVTDGAGGRCATGDPMVVVSSKTGEYLYFGRVKGEKRCRGGVATSFDAPLPDDIVSLADIGLSEWTEKDKRDVVHGRRKVDRLADLLYRPYSRGVGLVVSGCMFASMRGTGAVVQCANAIVENCTFENVKKSVEVTARLDWQEGPPPYNTIVRGCATHL